MNWLKGKKTYIIAGIAAILLFGQAVGGGHVPEEVWGMLGIGGAAAFRAGIEKAK